MRSDVKEPLNIGSDEMISQRHGHYCPRIWEQDHSH
jgi:hypothetical protein